LAAPCRCFSPRECMARAMVAEAPGVGSLAADAGRSRFVPAPAAPRRHARRPGERA